MLAFSKIFGTSDWIHKAACYALWEIKLPCVCSSLLHCCHDDVQTLSATCFSGKTRAVQLFSSPSYVFLPE